MLNPLRRRNESRLRPGDVVRIDGKLATVVSIHFPGGIVDLEPLAERLAESFAVSDRDKPIPMWDALIEAGWKAPE